MPIIKSAIKKVRSDKKKTGRNKTVINAMRSSLRKAKEEPTSESVNKAYSAIDKAAKVGVIKDNTAARYKSRLVKLAKSKGKDNPFGKSKKSKSQAKKKTSGKKTS